MKKVLFIAVAAIFLSACQQQQQIRDTVTDVITGDTGTCLTDGKYGGAQTTTADECQEMGGNFQG